MPEYDYIYFISATDSQPHEAPNSGSFSTNQEVLVGQHVILDLELGEKKEIYIVLAVAHHYLQATWILLGTLTSSDIITAMGYAPNYVALCPIEDKKNMPKKKK